MEKGREEGRKRERMEGRKEEGKLEAHPLTLMAAP